MKKENFKFGGNSGEIFQLGFVVKNLGEAVDFFSRNFKIGPFKIMDNFVAPNGQYRGSNENPVLSMAHVFSGRLFIELIEQKSEIESVYLEHIEKYGYGLHHLGISVAPEDYDKVLNNFYDNGFKDVFRDELPTGARIRYIAPKDSEMKEKMINILGAGYFECVEIVPGEENFFYGMREEYEKFCNNE